MNHALYAAGDPAANEWADKVGSCFARDRQLTDAYNNDLAGGKWKDMMIQKHIGYTIEAPHVYSAEGCRSGDSAHCH